VTIEKVGVVGAGLMGSEIALVFALAGKDVPLNDTNQASLDRAMGNLAGIRDKGTQRGFYAPEQKASTLARIRPTTDLGLYADRDMVIEAVFEDEQVKATTFKTLDSVCKPDCILASNTSSISISGLASHVAPLRRMRFVGPFELMDATQLSLSLQVEHILQGAYGERFQPRPLLKQMVQAGYNGKRVRRGWYRYDKKQER
jgi:3-hydroxybutyryl-CoA dehydrogenase